MQNNSLLVTVICVMAVLLVAGRCSDDGASSAAGDGGAQEAAPADVVKDDEQAVVDSGVETDPLGETVGGQDDVAAPVEDPGEAPADGDVEADDPTFELEPVPEAAADL